mmetsp:Transcript_27125/g.68051  ORF Transcript_27125/g.68051 Transcript_27125/m.68051 type:complete len:271 (+) Transcript_27125:186-998(+)
MHDNNKNNSNNYHLAKEISSWSSVSSAKLCSSQGQDVVRWFVEALKVFDVGVGSVLLAVGYFDRVWTAMELGDKVMDVAAACLWVAVKFNEDLGRGEPKWSEVMRFSGVEDAESEESRRTLVVAEKLVLKCLEWDLNRKSEFELFFSLKESFDPAGHLPEKSSADEAERLCVEALLDVQRFGKFPAHEKAAALLVIVAHKESPRKSDEALGFLRRMGLNGSRVSDVVEEFGRSRAERAEQDGAERANKRQRRYDPCNVNPFLCVGASALA